MRKTFLLFCSLFIGCMLSASAQKLQLSIEGGAQQSWIPNHTEYGARPECPPGSGNCNSTVVYDVNYTYKESPAGYLNTNLSYSSSERLQFYHTLGFSLLRFQPQVSLAYQGPSSERFCYDRNENGELVLVPCEDNSSTFYTDSRLGKTALLYAMQEIGARYQLLPRLWAQAGMDVSYRLHSQFYIPVLHYSQEDGYTVSTQKDRSGTGFAGILLGVHTGLGYALTDKLSLSMGLQHSLTPLYNAEVMPGKGYEKSRASQLRLGIAYRLESW